MITQEVIDAVNKKFKTFFETHYFKVRKDYSGMKATNQSTSLTFYITCDCYASWYQEENNVDSYLYAKLPYTDCIVLKYEFKADGKNEAQIVATLDKIFTDPDFLRMLDWTLPNISKKI